MPETVGDMMLRAATLLDDRAMVRNDPMMLRMYINEAQREIARRSECLRAKTVLPIPAAQSHTINLPVIRISEIYWSGATEGRKIPLVFRDHRANRAVWGSGRDIAQGTPEIYWTEGFPPALTVNLFPAPTRTGNLEIHYYRHATNHALDGLDDDQPLDLPQGWGDAITPYVLMRAYESQRKYETADNYRREFETRLVGLIEASTRFVDEPGSVMMDDWYDIFTEW